MIAIISNHNGHLIGTHFGGPARYEFIMAMPKPEGVRYPKQHRDLAQSLGLQRPAKPRVK
jgi:hypothetical protein